MPKLNNKEKGKVIDHIVKTTKVTYEEAVDLYSKMNQKTRKQVLNKLTGKKDWE